MLGMERGKDMKFCCFEVAYKKLQDCGLVHQEEAVEGVSPQLLIVPEAERMSEVLDETFGPLPLLAPVRKFKRQPSGHYTSKDVQDLFGKRRAANARERHRVQSINGGFSKLKSIVPLISKDRKPSKVHVLRAASEYIRLLRIILEESGGTEIADNNNNAQIPKSGESQSLENNVSPGSTLADHRPHHQEDEMGNQQEPMAYEEVRNIWDNRIMPFLGLVQLQDGSLIFQANEGSCSNVAIRLSLN
ncbi:factor in the germline alpha isoform X2 [Pristis pectinata]|uniref:factor in the germline alpha isoform X2 n=1 Tax=Pristis pectinata TaxID=685728 RepID=UPI00223E5B9E|nr:factor in the germline alpha isoform X2 [Pristis pectinata]